MKLPNRDASLKKFDQIFRAHVLKSFEKLLK